MDEVVNCHDMVDEYGGGSWEWLRLVVLCFHVAGFSHCLA